MANASVGAIPPEANSKGAVNAAPSMTERDPNGDSPKTDGPVIDPTTGAYAPAEYPLVREIPDAKGNVITRHTIRRDR